MGDDGRGGGADVDYPLLKLISLFLVFLLCFAFLQVGGWAGIYLSIGRSWVPNLGRGSENGKNAVRSLALGPCNPCKARPAAWLR